jgi:hypothetical protein
MKSKEELNRDILRGVIERENRDGRGVRPHEVEKTVAIAESLWKGQKGNGQAAKEAIEIVKRGLAE